MTYYALVIKTYNDGTSDKTSLYTYADDFDGAVAMVHTQWGQNVGADTIASIMASVIREDGYQYKAHTLYWVADTEEDSTDSTDSTTE